MKKILVSIATTLMATAVLVACNGTTGYGGGTGGNLAKAVCTSSANWNAVGIGMSLAEVRDILGKPTDTTVSISETTYTYDACRGFITSIDSTTGVRTGTDVSGSIKWTGAAGVTEINAPKRISATTLCELDYYNFPKGSSNIPCRTDTNLF
jgi:hypothetical protein